MSKKEILKTSKKEILKIKNFNKFYGNNHVLKDVSFSMNEGEVIAIIGASGGGKSTLLRSLTFLEEVQAGELYINGECIICQEEYFDEKTNESKFKSLYPKEEELRVKRLKMGLVFQDFNLFPHKTVIENLMLAPMLVNNLSKEDATELAIEQLTQVGLSEKADAYPCNLSGGQKQRVAIARALCMNPDILCFDEPTSALDPELTGEVLRVISEFKQKGVSMLIVTHEIMFAREVADTVIFLDNGIVCEYGNAKEVIDNPKNQRTKEFMDKILKAN